MNTWMNMRDLFCPYCLISNLFSLSYYKVQHLKKKQHEELSQIVILVKKDDR